MDIKNGDIITLLIKSNKSKNIIRQWGDKWLVCATSNRLPACDNRPALFIVPNSLDEKANDARRWIAVENDRDFGIVRH